ncbi:dihydrodipicolinate synthase family protein [Paralcaligenes ureilyticus]|uniref:Uncharacterized protein DUF993 n=1 Tax=Paralcaligenes ureilyticus TaxID=627131 RepID=A0A4R3LZZ5_9BURK|nr:dihydrodipicolinate synthase family protein [Paralcaligenes ureilyticus]TCT06310.1 uncharacterized protein DUF993 [Paralcaligenes ureilyticus]
MHILLPRPDGGLGSYTLRHSAAPYTPAPHTKFNRIAFAAAHVVADPTKPANPWDETAGVDWDATMAFREYLWSLGFKVAEAMDTAQRGMGLGWSESAELIRRSIAHARTVEGADLRCGVGTDQLAPGQSVTLEQVAQAYIEQFEVVEKAGGKAIMMASRALCSCARSADDYKIVYSRLLSGASDKVILHWLGDAFDHHLAGYWGSTDVPTAMATVVDIICSNVDKVEGIKISLLEAKWEVALRRRLPPGVRMYTGDDFNYSTLIAGDDEGHSEALLGIFDPIAPVAASALIALAEGNTAHYTEILKPTVALSRAMFRAPTQYYKAGVVFLAWLNGHQEHFTLLGGMQSARSALHYTELFQLADQCGALIKPELAIFRMRKFLSVYAGIDE